MDVKGIEEITALKFWMTKIAGSDVSCVEKRGIIEELAGKQNQMAKKHQSQEFTIAGYVDKVSITAEHALKGKLQRVVE